MRVFKVYTLEIQSPSTDYGADDTRVRAALPNLLEAIEEDLTDLLPEGWTAQIQEEESDE